MLTIARNYDSEPYIIDKWRVKMLAIYTVSGAERHICKFSRWRDLPHNAVLLTGKIQGTAPNENK